MWIDLEVVEENHRSDHPVKCYPCGQLFVVGTVLATAFTSGSGQEVGAVCPGCLAAGPEHISDRLERQARFARLVADELEEIASERVRSPTLEDLKAMERIAAL